MSQLVDSRIEVTQVDQYESDDDIIENNDSTKEVKNAHTKKRKNFWIKDGTFDTISEAEALVKNG